MICYKDKTFCADDVENHTCGREVTEEDKKKAKRMGLPIAYGSFCKEAPQGREQKQVRWWKTSTDSNN